MLDLEKNDFQKQKSSNNLKFANINNKNTVWTKIILLNEKNEPLISDIAHINVKINSINLSKTETFLNIKTNNMTFFEQKTTEYPEIPVCFIYFLIIFKFLGFNLCCISTT